MIIGRYIASLLGRRILRVCTAVGLLLLTVGAWAPPVEAATITLPSTRTWNCDMGVLEALPGAVLADGLLTMEFNCYMNNNSTSTPTFFANASAAIIAGTAPTAVIMRSQTTVGGSTTTRGCSTIPLHGYEHGALVDSGGTVLAPDSGESFPQNYVRITIRCGTTAVATSFVQMGFSEFTIGGYRYTTGTSAGTVPTSNTWGTRCGGSDLGATQLCARDLTDSGQQAAFDDFTVNPDWFGVYTGPVLSTCVNDVELSYELNGENVDVLQAVNVTVNPGDELKLILEIDENEYPEPINAESFGWRDSPGETFREYTASPFDTFGLHKVGEFELLGYVYLALKVTVGGGFALGTAELRCEDEEGLHYLDSGNNWNTTAMSNRACLAIQAVLPTAPVSTGDTISVPYTVSAGPYEDGDTWVHIAYVAGPGTPDADDTLEAFTVYGTQVGGDVPFTDTLPMATTQGVLRWIAAITDTDLEGSADPARGRLNCTDSTGTVRIYGAGTPVSGTFHVEPNGSRPCYSGAGMTLNPATWLLGFARMGTCLAGELFVPESEAISEVSSEAMTDIAEVPPFVFFATAATFVDTANESFQSPSGTGCFDLGGIVPGSTQDNYCVGSGAITSGGQRSILAMLMVGGIYLSLLMHAVSLVRDK